MKNYRRLLALVSVIVLTAGAWLWWNRPQPVNMAGYVPADSLVYIEAGNLPDIVRSLSATDAWKALAEPAGIEAGFGQVGWLSRLASWTGIGPADVVVFSRAQVAATVLGFDAADGGETLRIKPRLAVVVETHTGAGRARAAIEKRIGEFARRAYGDPRIEQREVDDASWIIWNAPTGERRIIAALVGSMAVIGNDETAVRACLAVRRGERPSLAGNIELEAMRRRVATDDVLAFGFISTQGAARLFDVAAPLYAGQLSTDPQVQSLAASILPQMARKILGGIGWSSRAAGGLIEDRYFITVQNNATAKLLPALDAPTQATWSASELLPQDTYSLSRYDTRDPSAAWRALNFALASQLDAVGAMLVPAFLKAALPRGIEEPESFLRAIGPEVVTARLDDGGESTVTIVESKDEKALREIVNKRLGTNGALTERIGDAELLKSSDVKRGAASFIAGHLLLGSTENVRRCLEARRLNRTLAISQEFQQAVRMSSGTQNVVVRTLTTDIKAARNFISFVAAQKGDGKRPLNQQALDDALGRLPYAGSETQLSEDGVARKTRSAFGQLGVLATQFAPNK